MIVIDMPCLALEAHVRTAIWTLVALTIAIEDRVPESEFEPQMYDFLYFIIVNLLRYKSHIELRNVYHFPMINWYYSLKSLRHLIILNSFQINLIQYLRFIKVLKLIDKYSFLWNVIRIFIKIAIYVNCLLFNV